MIKDNNIYKIPKFYMEIYSQNEIVLTGKIEIIHLSETLLDLNCNEQNIIFKGKKLNISSYSYNGIIISGNIENIEFI